MTTCEDSSNELTGMQVWISTNSPIAGASHGDLSTNCKKSDLVAEVVQIDLYIDTVRQRFVGVNFKQQFEIDGDGEFITVSAGDVSSQDLRRVSAYFDDVEKSGFFGFESR